VQRDGDQRLGEPGFIEDLLGGVELGLDDSGTRASRVAKRRWAVLRSTPAV
jgi:hypothetical protein